MRTPSPKPPPGLFIVRPERPRPRIPGLLSNQGEKCINLYFIMAPLRKSVKVWYSKAQNSVELEGLEGLRRHLHSHDDAHPSVPEIVGGPLRIRIGFLLWYMGRKNQNRVLVKSKVYSYDKDLRNSIGNSSGLDYAKLGRGRLSSWVELGSITIWRV